MSTRSKIGKLFDKYFWVIFVLLILLLVWNFWPRPANQPDDVGTFASSSNEFAGSAVTDTCGTHDSISQHYHFDITISVDNQSVEIPEGIGIVSDDCMRPIHTHDNTGHVHIELSSDYSGNTPTLHDFFQIWGYDFTANSVLNQTGELSMTINDGVIDISEKSPQGYRMADGDQIKISLVTS